VNGSNRTVLGLATAGNFAQLGARFLLGAVVPLVLVEFDATRSTVGLALGGMWAVYALAQFPSGVLGDRHGERRLLLAGMGGTAVGALLLTVAPSLLAFGLFAILLGAGAGLFFAPATSLLSRLYEEHGGALSVMTAGGAVAGIVYPAVGGLVGVRFGWRAAVGLGAVIALPLVVAMAVSIPRIDPVSPDLPIDEAADPHRLWALLTRPGVVYSVVVAVVGGYAFQAFSSFFPTFLVQYRGLDPGTAGIALGAAFALSAVVQPAAGRLSDVAGRDLALAGSFGFAGAGIAVLLTVPGAVGLLGGTAVLGAGVSWGGVVQARFMDQLDDDERGVGFGLVRTVYMFLATSGSFATGVLADLGGWPLAYGAVVALLVACLGLLGANRALGWGL
jgi:MFS family permease